MAITAGQRVLSTSLSQPFVSTAQSTADLTQTTGTAANIAGATVTFNTTVANVTAVVQGVFDVATTVAGAAAALGLCVVDAGSALNSTAIWVLTTGGARATITQVWTVALASAGSHTIKLQGNLSTAAGTATFNHPHTGITVTVFDY